MKLSRYFVPTLREIPADAQIVSHRYSLRAGLIMQMSAGIYAWLPLGLRVLRKVANIVREEMDKAGCCELLMPTLQSAELWQESGRYEAYGKEMLRIVDRHERELVYGPTNEEMVTAIFRQHVKSYRDLPKNLYQLQWKFRDEIRPRFGLMRGREFYMKDGYSFDLDVEAARHSYRQMYSAYLKAFHRMGLTAIPVRADSGAIGGDMSHEFHIVAPTGESRLYYDKAITEVRPENYNDFEMISALYAAADDKHDAKHCPVPAERLVHATGIEIGHIFYFGTKYSEAMKAQVMGPNGQMITVEMGSYGIGVSRLVAAAIEANHDEHGIIWPEPLAPYRVGIINLKVGDKATTTLADEAYARLQNHGVEVLYDDRDERPGAKFADMDLIGLPWQIIIGPQGASQGVVELKRRATGEKELISLESAISKLV